MSRNRLIAIMTWCWMNGMNRSENCRWVTSTCSLGRWLCQKSHLPTAEAQMSKHSTPLADMSWTPLRTWHVFENKNNDRVHHPRLCQRRCIWPMCLGPSAEDFDADRDQNWLAIRNGWVGIAHHRDETRRHNQSSEPMRKMETVEGATWSSKKIKVIISTLQGAGSEARDESSCNTTLFQIIFQSIALFCSKTSFYSMRNMISSKSSLSWLGPSCRCMRLFLLGSDLTETVRSAIRIEYLC